MARAYDDALGKHGSEKWLSGLFHVDEYKVCVAFNRLDIELQKRFHEASAPHFV